MKPIGQAAEAQIAAFELTLGFALPSDYKAFLLEANGAAFPDNRLQPVELDTEIMLDVLFGLGLDSNLDLKSVNDEYKEDLLPNSILIGCDSANNFIMLSVDAGNEGIKYFDHGMLFDSSLEGNVYDLAPNFTELIRMVKK